MPEFGGAGLSVNSTRAPVCNPTPVVLIRVLRVRCCSILISPPPAPPGDETPGGSRVYWILTQGPSGTPSQPQSACLRRKAGMSDESNADEAVRAPDDGARPLRITAGVRSS